MSAVLEKPARMSSGNERVSIYHPESSSLEFSVLPVFDDVIAERRHL